MFWRDGGLGHVTQVALFTELMEFCVAQSFCLGICRVHRTWHELNTDFFTSARITKVVASQIDVALFFVVLRIECGLDS